MDAEPEADPGSTQLRRSWQHAAAQAVAAVDALAAWRPSRSTPATDRWLWPAAQCGGCDSFLMKKGEGFGPEIAFLVVSFFYGSSFLLVQYLHIPITATRLLVHELDAS
ncbi:hypothetical protein BDA96_02G153800 [Sorghum bicolor]|uniref:Uncharacterized protein n=2 Tax=Sorghum bicolor TaxID=4558 RepID=A0A1W0W405_SORBI|nr:hypothetical protein BDA96_02G153800 [Sorghum bicolor]OQU89107.1 hypothetical protein SORBI_3002G147466 [Sorghum bicolor]